MSQFNPFFRDVEPDDCGEIVTSYECIDPIHPCHPDQGGCSNPACAEACDRPDCFDRNDYYACCFCFEEGNCCRDGGYPGCPCTECTNCDGGGGGGDPPGDNPPPSCEEEYVPIEIQSVSFEVDGSPGVVDELRNLDENSNCPVVNSTVKINAVIVGGQDVTVNYRFFIQGNSDYQSSPSDQFVVPQELSVFEDLLICEITASDVGGDSQTEQFNLGWVHGISPSVSNTLQSFVSIDDSDAIVQPGQSLTITYNENSDFYLGYPPASEISSDINGSNLNGNPVTYSVAADGDELDCKIVVNSVIVNNDDGQDPPIPRTSSVFTSYSGVDAQVAAVQNPIDGAPCGEKIGACCIGGNFDPITGITSGSCSQQTNADCTFLGGVYQGDDTLCSDFSGSPCEDEIGVGRCCCVQFDNTGQCKENLTFAECNSSNPDFANCGGSEDYPDIVWSHNETCSSPEPPCIGPPTGRCCEYIENNVDGLEGLLDGFTCGIGLEESDCPRYESTASFAFSFDGECPDCRDPSQHNDDCCPALGRCCSNGTCTPNQLRIDCPDDFDSTSNLCPNCDTNPGLPCCPALGRCCWKVGDDGNCLPNVTEAFCDSQEGITDWQQGAGCPANQDGSGCDPLTSETSPCCDTVFGRCCTRNTDGSSTCEQNQLFSSCNDSITQEWDETNSACINCSLLSILEREANKCCDRPRGRCCWKIGENGNCRENVTLSECSGLVGSSPENIILNGNFVEGESCPGDTEGVGCDPANSETDICCDTVRRACCKNGVCLGALSITECSFQSGNFIETLDSCPTCETDCPDLGVTICDDCCTAASLTFIGFTVDGASWDPNTNPIDRGSAVSLQVSSSSVSDIEYEFFVDSSTTGNIEIILQRSESNTYNIDPTIPVQADGLNGAIGQLPGEIIQYRITGVSDVNGLPLEVTGQLPEVVGDAPTLPPDISVDKVNGRRVSDVITSIGYSLVPGVFGPGVVLQSGGLLSVFPNTIDNTIVAMDPEEPPVELILFDGEGTQVNDFSTSGFYSIPDNVPGCQLKLKIRLENDYGSAEETYVVGDVRSGNLGDSCNFEERICCRRSGQFRKYMESSDGSDVFYRAGTCFGLKTKTECDAESGTWYPSLTECPCNPAIPEDQYGSWVVSGSGLGDWSAGTDTECCDVLKGRCCETDNCTDDITLADCDDLNGDWTNWILESEGNLVCDDYCADQGGGDCGCATTGVCCCASGGARECFDDISEEECDAFFCQSQSPPIFDFQPYFGEGRSCSECPGGLGDPFGSECCSLPRVPFNTYLTSSGPSPLCRISDGEDGQIRDNSCALPQNSPLAWTTGCDYREIIDSTSPDLQPICDVNSICSCYKRGDFGGGCGGELHVHRGGQKSNLVARCEEVVCEVDPLCCDQNWDDLCVQFARFYCSFGNDAFFNDSIIDGSALPGQVDSIKSEMTSFLSQDLPTCVLGNSDEGPPLDLKEPCVDTDPDRLEWDSCKNILLGEPTELLFGPYCSDRRVTSTTTCGGWVDIKNSLMNPQDAIVPIPGLPPEYDNGYNDIINFYGIDRIYVIRGITENSQTAFRITFIAEGDRENFRNKVQSVFFSVNGVERTVSIAEMSDSSTTRLQLTDDSRFRPVLDAAGPCVTTNSVCDANCGLDGDGNQRPCCGLLGGCPSFAPPCLTYGSFSVIS